MDRRDQDPKGGNQSLSPENAFAERTLARTAAQAQADGVPPETVAYEFMHVATVRMHQHTEHLSFYWVIDEHRRMLEACCAKYGIDTAVTEGEKPSFGVKSYEIDDKSALVPTLSAMDGLLRQNVPPIWIMQNLLIVGMFHFVDNLPPEAYRPLLRDYAIHMRNILADPAEYSASVGRFEADLQAGARARLEEAKRNDTP